MIISVLNGRCCLCLMLESFSSSKVETAWFISDHIISCLVRTRSWYSIPHLDFSFLTKLKGLYFLIFDLICTRSWRIFAIFINEVSSLRIRWDKCLFNSILGNANIWRVRSRPTFWISLSSLRSTLDSHSLWWFSKFIINSLIETCIWAFIPSLRHFSLSLGDLIGSHWVLIHKVVTVLIVAWPRTSIIIIDFFLWLEFIWWSTWRWLNIIMAWADLTSLLLINNILSFSSWLLKWPSFILG